MKAYTSKQDNLHKALEQIIHTFSYWIGSQHNDDYSLSWPDYQAKIQAALTSLMSSLDGKNVYQYSIQLDP